MRKSTVVIQEHNVEAQSLHNLVSYGHDKNVGIPIYSEPMLASVINTSSSTVTITTPADISNYWNVNNLCDYFILIDWINGVSEVKSLSSVISQVLNFENPIAETFTAASTVIYPLYIG